MGQGGGGGGVMEGDETGSEEGVKDEGRRTEELFKQKQRGESPQSSSPVFLICALSLSSSSRGASERRRQSLRPGPDVSRPSLRGHGPYQGFVSPSVLWFWGFFMLL